MNELQERFNNMHLLDRQERIKLTRELELLQPDFLNPFYPRWWSWRRCVDDVLIVCDGGLNFNTGQLGLSEFLTTFNQLQSTTSISYRLTLAHRGAIINSPNPLVVSHISNFRFDTSVNLADFEQVWLFGIDSFGTITAPEKTALETYMNGGGGLFATGDHGALGSTMCGDIVRVRDMRYWTNPPDTSSIVDSMNGQFRNDTNRPAAGDPTSIWFDNQSDEIPQTIGVRTFSGGLPHPLLSISPVLRPSRIIDIMPDHPHEGECKPETSFTVNAVTVPTQIIATSFVLGGSTTNGGVGGKALTVPHCFPSISVWDGRLANAGRIVVDSTWHHFVNINLNGVLSNLDRPGIQPGLTASDFAVVRQYFMNIATWMTRRRVFLCWHHWILFDLVKNSQIIEASLDRPSIDINEISLSEMASIGSLAEEILTSRFSPAFARSILLELMEDYNKNFADSINPWTPQNSEDTNQKEKQDHYYQSWFNSDLLLHTAIGSGFIALRDDKVISSDEVEEKDLDRVVDVFRKGMDFGFSKSADNFNQSLASFNGMFNNNNGANMTT